MQILGDYVVVVNADKVAFTGKKHEQKVFPYHTCLREHILSIENTCYTYLLRTHSIYKKSTITTPIYREHILCLLLLPHLSIENTFHYHTYPSRTDSISIHLSIENTFYIYLKRKHSVFFQHILT